MLRPSWNTEIKKVYSLEVGISSHFTIRFDWVSEGWDAMIKLISICLDASFFAIQDFFVFRCVTAKSNDL